MLWVLLALVAVVIVLAHKWEPSARKPLDRQPVDHSKTFANRAAVHEAGHAITVWCCTLVHEVGDVTIEHEDETMRGGLTTFWTHKCEETSESLWCDIVILLAGMAAEIAAFGKTRSGGCASDLREAAKKAEILAKSGNLTPPWKTQPRQKVIQFQKMIIDLDPEHARIMQEAYRMAHVILEAHGNNFFKVVSILLAKKTVSAVDIETVLGPRAFIKILGVTVKMGWFKPAFIIPTVQA